MLNANGPGFEGLYAGDTVLFTDHARWDVHPVKHVRARVLPLLVFADHVQVAYSTFGYTVDASNFIKLVRRGKRHIAADAADALRDGRDHVAT